MQQTVRKETLFTETEQSVGELTYLRDMLVEMRGLADRAGQGTLVYLIEMAVLEAEDLVKLNELSDALKD